MRIKSLFIIFALITVSGAAFADLEPYKDYDISDAVWSVTTVKVDANMGDAYLGASRIPGQQASKWRKSSGK